MPRLKSCKYCGRIHDSRYDCGRRPKYKRTRYNDTDAFRSSAAWQHKREQIRERDKNLCVVCRSNGRYEYNGLSCHHIEPLEERYDLRLEDENLIMMCQGCHESAEIGKISKDELRGLIPPVVCGRILQS